MHFFYNDFRDFMMVSKKVKVSKNNTSQHVFYNLNEYVVKIDYFDQKGTKNYENNVPLKKIFNLDTKSSETNINIII